MTKQLSNWFTFCFQVPLFSFRKNVHFLDQSDRTQVILVQCKYTAPQVPVPSRQFCSPLSPYGGLVLNFITSFDLNSLEWRKILTLFLDLKTNGHDGLTRSIWVKKGFCSFKDIGGGGKAAAAHWVRLPQSENPMWMYRRARSVCSSNKAKKHFVWSISKLCS